MRKTRFGLATVLGLSALLTGATALPATAAPTPQTVVRDLIGPLHLTSSGGQLYVADAFTGLVVKADPSSGRTSVVAAGVGAAAVSVAPDGRVFAAVGEGEGVTPSLVRLAGGRATQVADLLAHEKRFNPDGQPQRTGPRADQLSNPYDVLALRGRTLVADAAGNDVLSVAPDGTVSTLTVLPVSKEGPCATATNNGVRNGGCDPVPTGLALGSDGFLYVSGLGAEVEGHVWKIDLDNGRIVGHWGGLPPLTGIAAGGQGSIYVSSLFANRVFRLGPDGRVRAAVEVTGPTDVHVHEGQLYATSVVLPAGPTDPPVGSVVRLPLSAFFR